MSKPSVRCCVAVLNAVSSDLVCQTMQRQLERAHAVDFDIERTCQAGTQTKMRAVWVVWKVASVDRIYGSNFLDRGAVGVALKNVLQAGPPQFQHRASTAPKPALFDAQLRHSPRPPPFLD